MPWTNNPGRRGGFDFKWRWRKSWRPAVDVPSCWSCSGWWRACTENKCQMHSFTGYQLCRWSATSFLYLSYPRTRKSQLRPNKPQDSRVFSSSGRTVWPHKAIFLWPSHRKEQDWKYDGWTLENVDNYNHSIILSWHSRHTRETGLNQGRFRPRPRVWRCSAIVACNGPRQRHLLFSRFAKWYRNCSRNGPAVWSAQKAYLQ